MKKILCLILCLVVICVSSVCVSAAEELTTSTDCIYFKTPDGAGYAWNNFKVIFCHIWAEGEEGGDFYPWQAKGERCTDLGNGYWSYDISGFEFDKDKSYSVIFSNENGMQTYNLTLTSACRGDIAECNGDMCENPVDSEKICTVARWVHNGDSVHPSIQVSSQGTMLDPDNASGSGVDIRWGDTEGTPVNYTPVIQVEEETEEPTEEETEEVTEEETEPETEETKDEEKKSDDDDDKEDSDLTMWLIIGGAALVVIIGGVVAVVLIKRKKKQ